MWKPLSGLSLILCTIVLANDPVSAPSVSVECRGRLRHGIVAIGGETTGTTLTFHRTVWELQLQDGLQKEFAMKHHKEPVIAKGTLRKVAGTESKTRWIVDVKQLVDRGPVEDEDGVRLTIQGILRVTTPQPGEVLSMKIESEDQTWPIDLSSDDKLRAKAESLVGQSVLLSGDLESDAEKVSSVPVMIKVKTLDLPAKSSH